MIFVVDHVVQIVRARFVHGVKSVVEFMLVDIDAFLPRLFQLFENALRAIESAPARPPVSPSLREW